MQVPLACWRKKVVWLHRTTFSVFGFSFHKSKCISPTWLFFDIYDAKAFRKGGDNRVKKTSVG